MESRGEIIVYKADDGKAAIEVNLKEDTVWLNLIQMAKLFGRDKTVVLRHLHNIFKTKELDKHSVVANFATTATDGKVYNVDYYNLDAIISVGYRVNSRQGTRFRIWATDILKKHLIDGYTINERRLKEQAYKLETLQKTIAMIGDIKTRKELDHTEALGLLAVISDYNYALGLLDAYDNKRVGISGTSKEEKFRLTYGDAARAILQLKERLGYAELFGKEKDNDYFLWEDIYTVDQAVEVVNNEDPDVCYILLGGVDAAGHVFGAAHDLSEWDAKNTPDELSDDVSKVNRRANRLGQIKTVKTADEQLGRFVAYLKTRGTFDDSIMVVESDHDMETNFFAGPKLEQTLAKTGYSPKKDYFMFTVTQIGALFLRPGRKDPNIIPSLEKALEDYRMENPLTHELECPMVVYTREEMKTGIDKVTGQRFSPPGELYSEYYIEHPKPGNLSWPDMMLFTKKYYQFPLMGVGLANVGAGKLNIPLPKINIFVGGHGGPSTQPALLMFHGPGVPKAVAPAYPSMSADVAPTLYGLEGYKAPAVVQGKVLTDVARPQK